MPIDYTLEDALKRFELDLKRCLLPLAILLDVFPRPNKGHLHIVILPSELTVDMATFFHVDYDMKSILPPQLLGLGCWPQQYIRHRDCADRDCRCT
jgi:hypothetical protein